ncbi:hypothetical protein G6F66_015621 [Rhizopus arrhizus]|uniref:Uncharacterized protein n=1 Tax=Rhizopus oryzae TaxID=64495 RepID=A0A9P6WRZ9_RHIOR|nr:hypothetical protein G6F66_015621 [Rhizopus arrhizus]KAG1272655.1 hypothetical protein G6F64_015479 [Rhizopus arrhizus]
MDGLGNPQPLPSTDLQLESNDHRQELNWWEQQLVHHSFLVLNLDMGLQQGPRFFSFQRQILPVPSHPPHPPSELDYYN